MERVSGDWGTLEGVSLLQKRISLHISSCMVPE